MYLSGEYTEQVVKQIGVVVEVVANHVAERDQQRRRLQRGVLAEQARQEPHSTRVRIGLGHGADRLEIANRDAEEVGNRLGVDEIRDAPQVRVEKCANEPQHDCGLRNQIVQCI